MTVEQRVAKLEQKVDDIVDLITLMHENIIDMQKLITIIGGLNNILPNDLDELDEE